MASGQNLKFSAPPGTRGRKAILNGFTYTVHIRSRPGGWGRWWCSKRKECSAAIQINHAENQVKGYPIHQHLPDHAAAKAAVARHELLDRARNQGNVPTSTLTQETLTQVDSETRFMLPKEASLKRAVQRERTKVHPNPPADLSALRRLPEAYTNIDGSTFLVFDSKYQNGNGPESDTDSDSDEEMPPRVLVFARRRALRDLARSKIWYCDGTFKAALNIVNQLYTIHYRRHGAVFPGVYILMENRTRETYYSVFSAVKAALPADMRNGPELISSDFELAATIAFKEVFPQASEAYCFFHFSQSLWRHMQELGLAAHYVQEDGLERRKEFHSCLSLAFVPPNHVLTAFRKLKANVSQDMNPLLDYIGKTYVRNTGRRRPRYPIDTWNVYQRTLDQLDRTNNVVEAWHRRLNLLVGKAHPTLYTFLTELQKEEKYVETKREDLEQGNPPPPKHAKYRRNDERILDVVQRFNEYLNEENEDNEEEDPWESGLLLYLKSLGHSVRGTISE